MQAWAAIFDWDGVIVDSSRQHEKAWLRLADELQRPAPPGFFPRSFGMKNEKVIPELLGWTTDSNSIQALSLRKEEIFRELIKEARLEPSPGVLPFLDSLRQESVPCAVASSTPRENIRCVIDLLGLSGFFQAIVCGEDVTHGKPDPEVFLLAAEKLNVPPERCVVFEDAHVGITAARRANMKVVALATTHPMETLQDANRTVAGFSELNLADITRLFGG
jgi:beta-phosphoglucomutase family hydrolase